MAAETALHLVLTVAWVVLTDEISLRSLVVGYIVGAVVLWFYQKARGRRFYLHRVVAALKLFAVLVWEQVKSNIEVARRVLSPTLKIKPGIVAVPIRVTHDGEITAVANMITLTPGTITVDVSEDRKTLFVHVIDLDDPDTDPRSLLDSTRRFEELVMEVARP